MWLPFSLVRRMTRPAASYSILRVSPPCVVQYIVTEGGVAAVFTGQADDPSGSIVFHTARQPALRGTDGLSPRIVLCPVSAAVRGNDGGQVTGDVVFIPRFMALRVFHGN